MQLLWPANHNALSQGPDEQITIYFFWEIESPTQQLFGWQDLIRHIVHFHKFADFGSGKWSCPFLFSLNVWALLHNLSDHRYISCGKIWHHIHHGSNYAETKKNKKRRSLSSMYLDNEKIRTIMLWRRRRFAKFFLTTSLKVKKVFYATFFSSFRHKSFYCFIH